LDMVEEMMGDAIGYGGGDDGLRVMALAFGCIGDQSDPQVFNIIPSLNGNKQDILNALDSARSGLNPNGGSCPELAIDKMIQQVEDIWDESDDRPLKVLVSFTDGVIYNGNGNQNLATSNAVLALQERCTYGITLTPKFASKVLSPEQQITQEKYLNVLTSNIKKSQFEMEKGEAKVLPDVLIQMGNLFAITEPQAKCTSPQSYKDPEQWFCKYSVKPICENRKSCEWTDGKGCSKEGSFEPKCFGLKKKKCKKTVGCKFDKKQKE